MHVGSLVVCIDDNNWRITAFIHFNRLPVKNRLYKIRRIIPNLDNPDGPEGLALEGIYGDWDLYTTYNGNEVFEERHFRKDRFAEILSPVSEEDLQEEELVEGFEIIRANPGTATCTTALASSSGPTPVSITGFLFGA